MTAVTAQVLEELRAGRRVLLADSTFREAHSRFLELVAALTAEDGATVRYGSGREEIRHPSGGWARFGSVASGCWHGLTADTVYLPRTSTERDRGGIMPATAASVAPRVVEL